MTGSPSSRAISSDDGDIGRRFRRDHACRKALIHGGIGGIAPARKRIAGGVAFDLVLKPFPERPPGFSNSHFPPTIQAKRSKPVNIRNQTMA